VASEKAKDRLNRLKKEGQKWIAREQERLTKQADFLEAILKARGGSVGQLQDANAEGASEILEDSINDYLGRAAEPKKEKA